VRSSVRERQQCFTCSHLEGNFNEIRNITHVRGLVTLYIELLFYTKENNLKNKKLQRDGLAAIHM
jgi:hypothetical protein